MSLTTPRPETDDNVPLWRRCQSTQRLAQHGRTDGQTRTSRTWTIERSGDGLEAVVASRSRATPPGRQPFGRGQPRLSKPNQEPSGSAGTRHPSTRGQCCASSVLAPLLDEFVAVRTSGAEAAAAIAAGAAALSAIADAKPDGEQRARQELSRDVLREVTRAAKPQGKPTANMSTPSAAPAGSDFSHSEIAAAAHVSHGTVRAIPHPRQHHHRQPGSQPRSNRRTPSRVSSPHSRRPSPGTRRHPGAGPRAGRPQRAAQLLRTQVRALGQPLGQVIPIRPGAGEVDDAAPHAGRPQVGSRTLRTTSCSTRCTASIRSTRAVRSTSSSTSSLLAHR